MEGHGAWKRNCCMLATNFSDYTIHIMTHLESKLESILWQCPMTAHQKSLFCFKAGFRVCRVGAPCHLYQSCIWNLLSLCSHGALHPRSKTTLGCLDKTERIRSSLHLPAVPEHFGASIRRKKHTPNTGSGVCQGEVRMNMYKRYL